MPKVSKKAPRRRKEKKVANDVHETVTLPDYELQKVFDKALTKVREISNKYKIDKLQMSR